MKENWYALLATIMNPDIKYSGPALRYLGVAKTKPRNPLMETCV